MKTLALTFCFLFCITISQNLSCDQAQAQEVQRKAAKSPSANSGPRRPRARNNPRRRGGRRFNRGPNRRNRRGRIRIGVYPYHYRAYGPPMFHPRPYYYGHSVIIYPQPYPRRFSRPFFYFGW